jgi:hypothetical protein
MYAIYRTAALSQYDSRITLIGQLHCLYLTAALSHVTAVFSAMTAVLSS